MNKMNFNSPIYLLFIGTFVTLCNGHGRLIEPPSRASAWRYGFNTPPNYNDHELYCGGFNVQHNKNGGKCGECGDNFALPVPRPHEYGGKWGLGVIVRKYQPGAVMTIRVELTASHMGYFEFRVCENVQAKQECLDKHKLKILSGTPSVYNPNDLDTRFYPRNGSRIYEMKAQLPDDLICGNCVIQWKYIAGNNWGICPNGDGAVGCGSQEEFRACSDISIGKEGTTSRPQPPATKPSKPGKPTTITEIPETEETEGESPQGNKYVGIFIGILSLFLVLCGFAAIYLYNYHGLRIKHLLQRNKDQNQKLQNQISTISASQSTDLESSNPPVPPPRTKRPANIKNIGPEESSILTGMTIVSPSIKSNYT